MEKVALTLTVPDLCANTATVGTAHTAFVTAVAGIPGEILRGILALKGSIVEVK